MSILVYDNGLFTEDISGYEVYNDGLFGQDLTLFLVLDAGGWVAIALAPWILSLPFTQAVDVINNQIYPIEVRTAAASVVKLIRQKVVTRWGGSTFEVEWMDSMIARQRAEISEFAQIYDDAPIISGTEISALGD